MISNQKPQKQESCISHHLLQLEYKRYLIFTPYKKKLKTRKDKSRQIELKMSNERPSSICSLGPLEGKILPQLIHPRLAAATCIPPSPKISALAH